MPSRLALELGHLWFFTVDAQQGSPPLHTAPIVLFGSVWSLATADRKAGRSSGVALRQPCPWAGLRSLIPLTCGGIVVPRAVHAEVALKGTLENSLHRSAEFVSTTQRTPSEPTVEF